MVSFTKSALLGLATAGVMAAPGRQCLSQADAQLVAANYAELIRDYSPELADKSLAKDFVDYSESVNTLIDTCPQGAAAVTLPLLSPTFDSRHKFKVGQGQQPKINFHQLNLEYSCTSVTLRWKTTNTAPIATPRPVVGIILLEAEPSTAAHQYPWIVKTVYSEFDSGAWLQNLEQAGICPQPSGGCPIALPSGTVGTPPPPPASATAPSGTTPPYPSGSGSTSGYASGSGASGYSSPAASGYSSPTSAPASYTTSVTTDTCTDETTTSTPPAYSAPPAYTTSSAVPTYG